MELKSYIESYFGLGGDEIKKVSELFKPSNLKKNEFYLKRNQFSKKLSFVKSGFLRISAIDDKGEKEVTQWISGKDSFVTDLSSLIFDTPSRWDIQALTDCTLYTIHKEDYENIGRYVNSWDNLEKLFIAKCFVTLENRVFHQLSMSAEEKVKELLNRDAEIFLYVPHQYIASMIGMTPETLSRVRKKLSS